MQKKLNRSRNQIMVQQHSQTQSTDCCWNNQSRYAIVGGHPRGIELNISNSRILKYVTNFFARCLKDYASQVSILSTKLIKKIKHTTKKHNIIVKEKQYQRCKLPFCGIDIFTEVSRSAQVFIQFLLEPLVRMPSQGPSSQYNHSTNSSQDFPTRNQVSKMAPFGLLSIVSTTEFLTKPLLVPFSLVHDGTHITKCAWCGLAVL